MYILLIISIAVLLLILITFIYCSLQIAHETDERKIEK